MARPQPTLKRFLKTLTDAGLSGLVLTVANISSSSIHPDSDVAAVNSLAISGTYVSGQQNSYSRYTIELQSKLPVQQKGFFFLSSSNSRKKSKHAPFYPLALQYLTIIYWTTFNSKRYSNGYFEVELDYDPQVVLEEVKSAIDSISSFPDGMDTQVFSLDKAHHQHA